MTELREHGIGSIAIMSNDPAAYPDDSFDRMKAFAARARVPVSLCLRRNAGRRAHVRRRLHARFLRLRPQLQARLPRPARRVGTLVRSARRRASSSTPWCRSRTAERRPRFSIRRSAARSSGGAWSRKARNASSTASGCSAISAWPQSGIVTTFALGSAAIRPCAFFGGAIRSRAPRIDERRAADLGRALQSCAVLIARDEIGVEHARLRALQEAQRVAGEPQAGHLVAAELLARAVRPAGDELAGDVIVALRGVEQHFGDGHRRRRTEQRELRHALRMPRRALERRERSERMADERRALDRRRVERSRGSSPRAPRRRQARRRPICRGRAGRRRAHSSRGARSSAIAAPRRCARCRRRGRRRTVGSAPSSGREPVYA